MVTKRVKVLVLKKQLLIEAGVDGGEMETDSDKYKRKRKANNGQESDREKVKCLD